MLLRSKSILRRKSAEEDGVGKSAASIETAGRCCPVGARRDGDYCGVLSLDAGALPVRMQVKMAAA